MCVNNSPFISRSLRNTSLSHFLQIPTFFRVMISKSRKFSCPQIVTDALITPSTDFNFRSLLTFVSSFLSLLIEFKRTKMKSQIVNINTIHGLKLPNSITNKIYLPFIIYTP